ncbi:DEAD/DEAH box helicase [Proteinivorax hydrogeniformans]|uniref:ATP-dependent RNA helicase CshA n=1 Tax=Proteinivorax hydrogeniformans TaxID=1826727 RepID=A0AAU8HT54_9FIRM
MTTFFEFGLRTETTKALTDMGFEEATPIQDQAIPIAISGADMIGQAQTGTGKTAAFGVALAEKLEEENNKVQGIVLTPTRELAIQVAEELNKICQHTKIKTLPIYGGQDIGRQIKALKRGPQIIVATPGRLMDHMRRRNIRLDNIKMVVLDEADEMLNMGFVEDIEFILNEIPTQRQTLLFSATMPKAIKELSNKFLVNPKHVAIKPKKMTAPNIEQEYIEVPEKQKFDVLCRLLDIHLPELAIVFGRTKRRVDELSEGLNKRGYSAEGIHGDLTQGKRDSVMRRFKNGSIEVLVATDVAARGLDITGVTHVYNFDIPQDAESYVHRIGRTGRAGKTGLAITFATSREMAHLKSVEKVSKGKITRRPIPSFSEAIEGQKKMTVEKLLSTVESDDYNSYKGLAEQLLEEVDSVTLLSASLKLLTKEPNNVPVKLTGEPPVGTRSGGYKGKGGKGGNFRRSRSKKGSNRDRGGKKSGGYKKH